MPSLQPYNRCWVQKPRSNHLLYCNTNFPQYYNTFELARRLLGTSASDHIASASSSTLTLMMVVLEQVSTRGASNTLRLACETLEVRECVPLTTAPCRPVPPPRIAPYCSLPLLPSRRNGMPLSAAHCPVAPLPPRIAPHCPLLPLTSPRSAT